MELGNSSQFNSAIRVVFLRFIFKMKCATNFTHNCMQQLLLWI